SVASRGQETAPDRGGDRDLVAQRETDRSRVGDRGTRGVESAKARGVGRPSLVETYREQIVDVLAAEPKLKTIEILHRVRANRGSLPAARKGARMRRPEGGVAP